MPKKEPTYYKAVIHSVATQECLISVRLTNHYAITTNGRRFSLVSGRKGSGFSATWIKEDHPLTAPEVRAAMKAAREARLKASDDRWRKQDEVREARGKARIVSIAECIVGAVMAAPSAEWQQVVEEELRKAGV